MTSALPSLLAFVDPGLAKGADCSALLAQGKAAGVPVEAGARSRTDAHGG